jgi:hypothetical protein
MAVRGSERFLTDREPFLPPGAGNATGIETFPRLLVVVSAKIEEEVFPNTRPIDLETLAPLPPIPDLGAGERWPAPDSRPVSPRAARLRLERWSLNWLRVNSRRARLKH